MTRKIGVRFVVGCACALLVLAAVVGSSTAKADMIVSIEVSAGGHSNTWMHADTIVDPYSWTLAAPVNIYSSTNPGLLLATIQGVNVSLEADPQVVLGFFVQAGAVDTNFTISSAVVNFPAINNPDANASAAVTVTDTGANGASITGAFPASKIYEAQYNNAGSVFADLVSPVVVVPPTISDSDSEQFPLVGTTPIAGSVFNIQSQFKFLLTANDLASGTGVFTVVPEPSAIVLAMIGGAALLWWARRRK